MAFRKRLTQLLTCFCDRFLSLKTAILVKVDSIIHYVLAWMVLILISNITMVVCNCHYDLSLKPLTTRILSFAVPFACLIQSVTYPNGIRPALFYLPNLFRPFLRQLIHVTKRETIPPFNAMNSSQCLARRGALVETLSARSFTSTTLSGRIQFFDIEGETKKSSAKS